MVSKLQNDGRANNCRFANRAPLDVKEVNRRLDTTGKNDLYEACGKRGHEASWCFFLAMFVHCRNFLRGKTESEIKTSIKV